MGYRGIVDLAECWLSQRKVLTTDQFLVMPLIRFLLRTYQPINSYGVFKTKDGVGIFVLPLHGKLCCGLDLVEQCKEQNF